MTELTIERVVAGGFGLARTDEGVALVRGGLPGERVEARLERRKGTLRGDVVRVIEPHEHRVESNLPPGADLPLDYEAQLPIKEALVREALERIAKLDAEIEPIRRSPAELGYRTSAQYAALAHGGIAARAPGGDTLVPLEQDPLVAPPLAKAIDALRHTTLKGVVEIALRGSLHEDRALVGLVARPGKHLDRIAGDLTDNGVAGVTWVHALPGGRFTERAKRVRGTPSLVEDFGGVLATVTAHSFAQVNPPAAGALYLEAGELSERGDHAVDLYAGGGVLSFHLAHRFTRVTAIEISRDAVRRGEADRARLGLDHITFRRRDARALAKLPAADLVAANPPRAGIDAEVIEPLTGASRILYVSCDPPTWARDVGRLAARGFRLTAVRPFDFYPYTHHVEILSLLER